MFVFLDIQAFSMRQACHGKKSCFISNDYGTITLNGRRQVITPSRTTNSLFVPLKPTNTKHGGETKTAMGSSGGADQAARAGVGGTPRGNGGSGDLRRTFQVTGNQFVRSSWKQCPRTESPVQRWENQGMDHMWPMFSDVLTQRESDQPMQA